MSVPGKYAPSLYFVLWCLTKNPRHFSNHKKGRSSCSDEDRQAETLACGLAWPNKVVQQEICPQDLWVLPPLKKLWLSLQTQEYSDKNTNITPFRVIQFHLYSLWQSKDVVWPLNHRKESKNIIWPQSRSTLLTILVYLLRTHPSMRALALWVPKYLTPCYNNDADRARFTCATEPQAAPVFCSPK